MSGKTTPHLHMTSTSLTTTVDTIRTGLTMTRMRTTSQPARPRRSSPSRSAKTKPKKKNRKASRSDDGGRFSFTSPLVWLGFPFAATFATIAALFIVPGVGVILAIIVLIVGLILMGIGGIRLLIGAFQEDVVCGLLYLFVPFYSLYYLVTRWEEQKSAFLMNVCGGLLVCGASIALPAAQQARNKARNDAGAAAITVPLSEVPIALYINETVPDVARFLRVNHSARGNFAASAGRDSHVSRMCRRDYTHFDVTTRSSTRSFLLDPFLSRNSVRVFLCPAGCWEPAEAAVARVRFPDVTAVGGCDSSVVGFFQVVEQASIQV